MSELAPTLRLVVTGGRDFPHQRLVEAVLSRIHTICRITELTHGYARGVDSFAATWAHMQHRIVVRGFRANWSPTGKLQRSAGALRNQQMLDEVKPDCCVAFPGGAGTLDMVTRAALVMPVFMVGSNAGVSVIRHIPLFGPAKALWNGLVRMPPADPLPPPMTAAPAARPYPPHPDMSAATG